MIIFAVVQIFSVWNYAVIVCEIFMGINMISQATLQWKTNKEIAIFSLCVAVAVTAYSTQATIGAFSNAIIMGVCSSASIFSGLYYGERNKSALKAAFRVSCKYGLLFSVVLTALFFGFSNSLAHLMLDDKAEALRLTTQAVRLLSISFPVEMLSLILIYHYLFTKKYMLTYVSYLLHNLDQ